MHPPPHKDVWDPAGRRKSGGKKGKYDEQFRFLRKEIEACFKGKGAELCWPFLAPVGAFFPPFLAFLNAFSTGWKLTLPFWSCRFVP